MLDEILIPEIKKNYEELARLEAGCTEEEKLNKHQVFKETLSQLLMISNIARKEGIIALEEEAERNYELSDMTRELIWLIVDGTDPQLVERIGLMQYFAKKKDVYQSIMDIMSIYGMLSIQAGYNPRIIWKMLNSMIPDDVTEPEYYYDNSYADEIENCKKLDWEAFYQGNIRLTPEIQGYSEIKLLDELIKVLDNRAIQKILRGVGRSDLHNVMNVISGEARKLLFTNMSKYNAYDIAIRLNLNNDMKLKNQHVLDWTFRSVNSILKMIIKLEDRAEIIIAPAPDSWIEYKKNI